MTSKEIFQQYFKKKLIAWVSIGVAAFAIRLLAGHETSFVFGTTIILFFIVAAIIAGYVDYNYYEKSAPRIIAQLLGEEPLKNFQTIGFLKQEGNKLEGEINNYKVILSPLTNLQGDKVLTVLIPLQIREGLNEYFTKYNEAFKFSLSGEIVFAEAILKNYKKEYNYSKLFSLIDKTTISLRHNKIEPLNIVDN